MVHTHDGAAASCMALAYGTPKDRKKLIKGMKGFVWQMAENEWGFAVVCTALAVVDDTALTAKIIGADIKVGSGVGNSGGKGRVWGTLSSGFMIIWFCNELLVSEGVA